MGSNTSALPVSQKKVVPIQVVEHAAILNARLNALRLILRNKPFQNCFIQFVHASNKAKLVTYYEELEMLKKIIPNSSAIPNPHDIIIQNSRLQKLFSRASDIQQPNPTSITLVEDTETVIMECFEPLFSLQTNSESTGGVTNQFFIRSIRICQNNLLCHLIPELTLYLTSDAFHEMQHSDIFITRQVYKQIQNASSKRETSVTAASVLEISQSVKKKQLPSSSFLDED